MEAAVRRMRADDIPQVVDIEQEAFSPGWIGTPFRRDLNSRYCRFLVAYLELPTPQDAAADDAAAPDAAPDDSMWARMVSGVKSVLGLPPPGAPDELAGYVSIWFQAGQAHITEIAVREALRGQGIGELLLIGTLRTAYRQGMDEVTLEARVSNFIAQRLYEKYGFHAAGIRKNYYADNKEDAVIMTTDPIHTAAYRRKFYDLEQRFLQRYGPIRIDE